RKSVRHTEGRWACQVTLAWARIRIARCGPVKEARVRVLRRSVARQRAVAFQQFQLCGDSGGVLTEPFQRTTLQRLRLRQRHGQRIAMDALDAEFVVKMRAAGETGHADIADHIALLDPVANAGVAIESRKVGVQRRMALAMVDHHGVSVTTLAAAELDPARAGGIDRRARGRCIVDAAMCADPVENGVLAREVEARTDASEVDGRAQEILAQGPTVLVVVLDLAVGVYVAEGDIAGAAIDEAHRQHVAVADLLAIVVDLLVDDV